MKKKIRQLLRVLFSVLLILGTAGISSPAAESSGIFRKQETGFSQKTSSPVLAKKKKKNKQKNADNSGSNNSSGEKSGNAGTGSGSDGGTEVTVEENGTYTSKEEVALYLHLYGHLPDNYITKNEAKKLGWNNADGNLDEVAPGKSIGGDYFGNYEGQLPEKKGREYHECDIDYTGGWRNAKRILYSNDGLIFYTEDHYNTFEQLYPNNTEGNS